MSGGRFEYAQYKIGEIAKDIEVALERSGTEIPIKERWKDKEWYEKHPEDGFYDTYDGEIKKRFEEAIKVLKKAEVYAQRIDWYLSGDDGEESFLKRLKEDLSKLDDVVIHVVSKSVNMELDKKLIIDELVTKLAEKDNRIDLNAYYRGLDDMYDAIDYAHSSLLLKTNTKEFLEWCEKQRIKKEVSTKYIWNDFTFSEEFVLEKYTEDKNKL